MPWNRFIPLNVDTMGSTLYRDTMPEGNNVLPTLFADISGMRGDGRARKLVSACPEGRIPAGRIGPG